LKSIDFFSGRKVAKGESVAAVLKLEAVDLFPSRRQNRSKICPDFEKKSFFILSPFFKLPVNFRRTSNVPVVVFLDIFMF
jgi:hypothetical protein